MWAVILIGVHDKNLYPITYNRPASFIKYGSDYLIEYTLNNLYKVGIKKIICVGGKNIIKKINIIKRKLQNIEIKYVCKKTYESYINCLEKSEIFNFIKGEFLVIFDNSYVESKDITRMIYDNNTSDAKIGCVNCFPVVISLNKKQDIDLIKDITCRISNSDMKYISLKNSLVFTWPWDLLKLNEIILKKEIVGNSKKKLYDKEENVIIEGDVYIGKNTEIRGTCYIKGPASIGKECLLGPYSFIRPYTIIGDYCEIGHNVEIKNSLIMDNTRILHNSFVGDSIIGSNCNIGAGTVLSNLRFDEKKIIVKLNNKKINTNLKKLGTIMGDNVKVGINCSFMPGSVVKPMEIIMPNSIIRGFNEIINPYF